MVWRDIKPVLLRQGGDMSRFSVRDRNYRSATRQEILDGHAGFRRFLFMLGLLRFKPEANDCDNYQLLYKAYRDMRYGSAGVADPTGLVDYCIDGNPHKWHAINFVVCGQLVHYVEPQNVKNPIVTLTPEEKETLTFVML